LIPKAENKAQLLYSLLEKIQAIIVNNMAIFGGFWGGFTVDLGIFQQSLFGIYNRQHYNVFFLSKDLVYILI
jgi:hypothetical protein